MEMLEIKLKAPLIRSHDGHGLEVTEKEFLSNPGRIYHVPASPGWVNECFHENGKALLVRRYEKTVDEKMASRQASKMKRR